MLKTTISLQIFVANNIFIVNEINDIEDNNKLIEKFVKQKLKNY